ncbi:MAG: hypothetical protein Q9197_002873 [Variospora fuerteventurae]
MDRSAVGDTAKPPLREQPSNASDYTVDSTSSFVNTPTIAFTPDSPVHHRTGYRRVASFNNQDTAYHGPDHPLKPSREQEHGLGIKNLKALPSSSQASLSGPDAPASAKPLLFPPFVQPRREYKPAGEQIREENGNWDGYTTDPYQFSVASSESQHLREQTTAPTGQSFEPPVLWCKSKEKFHHGKGNWLAISILALSVYSTLLSGLWLGVAIAKPRFGHGISPMGRIPPPTASLLAAAIAKSIELSFVTVFVAFLGQVLSRRALVKKSKGITISEMSMRQWVMQPGTLITHWQTVRYAVSNLLGVIALCGALAAILYTTASESLVAPKLKMGTLDRRLLYGRVATSFANEPYIGQNCQTPISVSVDPEYSGSTCTAIEHSGQAYHNYMQYLSNWTSNIAAGRGSSDLSVRPAPLAQLYDNTTVEGSWVSIQNMTELSRQHSPSNYRRVVTNVTMAMPHAGVFGAMRDPINNILQPEHLEASLGSHPVEHASVPSPVINVLCASMQKEELASIVYSEWPRGNGTAVNVTGWPSVGFDIPVHPSWLNSTPVDDLFGFGEKYERRPPVFPKLPLPYNTVLNSTGWFADSIYLLATSATEEYTMCSLRASLTARCSTEYEASISGGSMNAHCEDPDDDLAYGKSYGDTTDGVIVAKDWATVAGVWGKALSLNAGITDSAASNGRLLTQLIPTTQGLDPSLPSIAEALAVLAGSTLLLSSSDSPFIHFWNYSATVMTLKEPQHQAFTVALRFKDFASGGTQQWQGIFYVVLFLTFATNVCCLIYFLVRQGLVTDFMEPQNLFSLSLNSPPSQALDGACGSGPVGEQLLVKWYIKMDQQREHFYIENGEGQPSIKRRKTRPLDFETDKSPIVETYTKLSSRHSSLL